MSTQFAVSVGELIGVIIDAAIADARDLEAIRRDVKLFELALCSDDLTGLSLEEPLEKVRRTPGHPKTALLDYWEQPRLIKGSPRSEFRSAEALAARKEIKATAHPTIDNLISLTLARGRVRTIAQLYGGLDEVYRKRELRERTSTPDAKQPRQARGLTKLEVEQIDGEVEALVIACWLGQVHHDLFLSKLKKLAVQDGGDQAAKILSHLQDGDLVGNIDKLGKRIKARNHRRLGQPTQETGTPPGPEKTIGTSRMADVPPATTESSFAEKTPTRPTRDRERDEDHAAAVAPGEETSSISKYDLDRIRLVETFCRRSTWAVELVGDTYALKRLATRTDVTAAFEAVRSLSAMQEALRAIYAGAHPGAAQPAITSPKPEDRHDVRR